MKDSLPNQIQPRYVLEQLKAYVPGTSIAEVQNKYKLEHVIKLASNENPLGPSPRALTAISEALSDLHRYPDDMSQRLRMALAVHYDLQPAQVLIGNGGDEVIQLIARAYLDPGDDALGVPPTFTEYQFASQLMGAEFRWTRPMMDQYDVDAVLEEIRPHTRVVFLCSPNNPTGTYWKRNNLKRLLTQLPDRVLLVLDAAYGDYAVDQSDYTDGTQELKEHDNLLIIRTFSKIYGLAGLRVGYVLGDEKIINNLLKVKEPFNVNTLAQIAATAALGDEAHVTQSQQLTIEGRVQLTTGLRQLGLTVWPSGANFILVHTGPQSQQLYEHLMQQGVIVRFGQSWGLSEHLRISIGLPQENAYLIQLIAAYMNGQGG